MAKEAPPLFEFTYCLSEPNVIQNAEANKANL